MPLPFWLLAGVSSVALAAAILTFFPRTVLAYALLPKATAVAPSAPVVVSKPTPTFVEDVQAEKKIPAHLLHGVASWYGSVFNGRQTASGETFNMYAMTACHPTLPFGTKVRVVNTANHKSVVVRITDRGLLYDGRILDLSYGAAQKLGMVNVGVARVKIQVLKTGYPQQNQ